MFPSLSLRGPKKRSRTKSDDTYVFRVDIVQGGKSDTRQTTDVVPTLALFNASSQHSWISKRFAQKLNIINDSSDGGIDLQEGRTKSVRLAWRAKTLGRYTQRTVFLIALEADFDILFGDECDENTRPHQATQFERGIREGTLKKFFQDGIESGLMLRVVEYPSKSNSTPVMPTLAQLEDQLALDMEAHQCYHKLHDSNIYSVRTGRSSDCCNLYCESKGERPLSASKLLRSAATGGSQVSHNIGTRDNCEDDDAKHPSKRSRPISNSYPAYIARESDNFVTTKDLNPNHRENPPTASNSSKLVEDKYEPVAAPRTSDQVCSSSSSDSQSGNPQIIRLVRGGRRKPRSLSHDRDKIRRKKPACPKHHRPQPLRKDGSQEPYAETTTISLSTLTRCSSSSSSTSNSFDDGASTGGDLKDPDYWKWDEAEKNWFHVDKATSEVLWYDAPP